MTLSRKAATFAKARGLRSAAPIVLLTAVLGVAQPALGWSEAGHLTIAEYAMRSLPEHERQALNKVAATLVRQDSGVERLRGRYNSFSSVALTASWLDTVRGREVKSIFADFGSRLPSELASYARTDTDDWHYSNRPWHENKVPKRCHDVRGGRLNDVMPRLQQAFAAAEDPRDKAVALAMLVHLVADAHQPLHTATRMDGDCRHDRGGNGFCIKKGSGRCELNLHQLWDRGFGTFGGNPEENLRRIAGASAVSDKTFRPEAWQEENLTFAAQIYAVSEGQPVSQGYQRLGREIVRVRAKQAGERLAALLQQLAQVSDRKAEK